MYLDPTLTTDDRWHVTRMIYGSQTDSFDFHKVDCRTVLLHSLRIIHLLPSVHHPSAPLCASSICSPLCIIHLLPSVYHLSSLLSTQVGFDAEILNIFLSRAGFCKIERVGSFNMPFRDTSDLVFRGHFVSLNIAAKVCYDEQQFAMDPSKHRRSKNEAVDVNHQADPYREP
jgi:hypothetical protein